MCVPTFAVLLRSPPAAADPLGMKPVLTAIPVFFF